jgi:hypothetical protein
MRDLKVATAWATGIGMGHWTSLGSQDSHTSVRTPGIFTDHYEQGHSALPVWKPAAKGTCSWSTIQPKGLGPGQRDQLGAFILGPRSQ